MRQGDKGTVLMVYNQLPGDIPHGWKFIKVGPDGKLYLPVGAPCNICEPSDQYAQIRRINLDGSGMEVVGARRAQYGGVRLSSQDEHVKPAVLLGAHAAPLGMRF